MSILENIFKRHFYLCDVDITSFLLRADSVIAFKLYCCRQAWSSQRFGGISGEFPREV